MNLDRAIARIKQTGEIRNVLALIAFVRKDSGHRKADTLAVALEDPAALGHCVRALLEAFLQLPDLPPHIRSAAARFEAALSGEPPAAGKEPPP
jgi:hypothetical protein